MRVRYARTGRVTVVGNDDVNDGDGITWNVGGIVLPKDANLRGFASSCTSERDSHGRVLLYRAQKYE